MMRVEVGMWVGWAYCAPFCIVRFDRWNSGVGADSGKMRLRGANEGEGVASGQVGWLYPSCLAQRFKSHLGFSPARYWCGSEAA